MPQLPFAAKPVIADGGYGKTAIAEPYEPFQTMTYRLECPLRRSRAGEWPKGDGTRLISEGYAGSTPVSPTVEKEEMIRSKQACSFIPTGR
jgi:hypothetical protein